MNVIWMDLYRFIHYTKMFHFYYLRYLNLITHKVLSVGVEIAVGPLLSRDQLGHLCSDLCTGQWSKQGRISRESGVTDFVTS